MKLNKSQGDLLKRVIERWEADGTITLDWTPENAESYGGSVEGKLHCAFFRVEGVGEVLVLDCHRVRGDRCGVGVGGSFDHGFT